MSRGRGEDAGEAAGVVFPSVFIRRRPEPVSTLIIEDRREGRGRVLRGWGEVESSALAAAWAWAEAREVGG